MRSFCQFAVMVSVALGIAACGSSARLGGTVTYGPPRATTPPAQARAEFREHAAECRQIPEQRGTMLKRAECITKPFDELVLAIAPRDVDLAATLNVENQKQARRVDTGDITIEKYNKLMRGAYSDLVAASNQRDSMNSALGLNALAKDEGPQTERNNGLIGIGLGLVDASAHRSK